MTTIEKKIEAPVQESAVNLGKWIGRHQAFNLLSKRCSAADAECLKAMRDSGEYKLSGKTWGEFCETELGVSKAWADRQVQYIEKYGPDYHRTTALVPMSGETYELIADSISGDCLEIEGERIPLTPENRKRIAAAVKKLRDAGEARSLGSLRKRTDALLREAREAAQAADKRLELLALLMEVRDGLEELTENLRRNTLVLG